MCPVGYYESEGTCKQCPLDQYNEAEQATECKACPNGKKTLEKGSTSLDQCIGEWIQNDLICLSFMLVLICDLIFVVCVLANQ